MQAPRPRAAVPRRSILPAKSFMGSGLRRDLGSAETFASYLKDVCCQLTADTSSAASSGAGAFLDELSKREGAGRIPAKEANILRELLVSYSKALKHAGNDAFDKEAMLIRYLDLIEQQVSSPHKFDNYHQQLLSPVDYYSFANDFLRPLIDRRHSFVSGKDTLDQMQSWLAAGHNVVLLANHQSEADPGLLALVTEGHLPEEMIKSMIFIAGDRVLSDPLIVPFSLGRNCLTVISKRHQGDTPEEQMKAKAHNAATMKKMGELFARGGKCVYVAPSGGRDRPAADNAAWKTGDPVEVHAFDPSSVELFRMVGQTEGLPPCHFVPLAMDTHDLMPPPRTVEAALGERRDVHHVPVCLHYLPEVPLGTLFASGEGALKGRALREARGKHVWEQVRDAYLQMKAELKAKGYVPPADD
eukprot:tig00020816_g14195.t1